MKKFVLAAVAVLAIAGSGAAYAQHRSHDHSHFSAEDKAAFLDARIASVKAGLKLTPDQEKNWPAVESAVRDFSKQKAERAEARRAARQARRDASKEKSGEHPAPVDPMARLQKRADDMAATAAGLKHIAEAADPLYKSLDDAQKRRFAMLMHFEHHRWEQHRRFERHHGGRRHGWHNRFENNDREGDEDPGNL